MIFESFGTWQAVILFCRTRDHSANFPIPNEALGPAIISALRTCTNKAIGTYKTKQNSDFYPTYLGNDSSIM